MVAVRHFPPLSGDRRFVPGPVEHVTLLEDRAQVRRTIRMELDSGVNRIALEGVAPTLQDVSLTGQVTSDGARLTDARCRRAMRVWHEDQPAPLDAIEAEIEELQRELQHTSEDRARVESRHQTLLDIVHKGADEIPTDASWGMIDHEVWKNTFDTLFKRLDALHQEAYDLYHRQLDVRSSLENVSRRRAAAVSTRQRFVGWLELDLLVDRAGSHEITIEYVVPNALWRPMHRAQLVDGRLSFVSSAVIWQNTQEDWTGVQLAFSTARSALGTEPPVLTDDLLAAQRREEQVAVEAREVRVQRAKVEGGPGSGGGHGGGRELPGVDDGGEIQNIEAPGRHDVPSDGRPVVVEIGSFESPCDPQLVAVPELATKAFLETRQPNEGARPILAGPVELVRNHGYVGWTQVLFVAPKERFSLSFGPDAAVRLTRRVDEEHETNHLDGWRTTTRTVHLYLSNLGGDPKRVVVTERIPVSEVEQVRIVVQGDDAPDVDDDGFVKWNVDIAPHGRERRTLVYAVSVAPGVEGL